MFPPYACKDAKNACGLHRRRAGTECAAACEQGCGGWSKRGPAVHMQAAWQHCVSSLLMKGASRQGPLSLN